MGSLLLLGAALLVCALAAPTSMSWFRVPANASTETLLASTAGIEFRGCFVSRSPFCLYLGPTAEGAVRLYVDQEEVWVTPDNRLHFGPRPLTTAPWVDRVSSSAVVPPAQPTLVAPAASNPKIQALVDAVSIDRLRADIDKLAAFQTRNSLSPDAVQAANWLKAQVEALGCGPAQLKPFRSGYSPNVVCTIESTNRSYVIVGAHYDSRATSVSSPTQRAPGADDNGTGTAALLELLRLISQQNLKFANSIMFAFFSGEEQGLYGSAALAAELRGKASAMVNADMIGYERRQSNTVFFDRDRVTKSVQDLGREMVRLYMPGVKSGEAVGCCSDGENFYNQGIATGSIFESRDIENPNYHQSSDLPPTLSYEHLRHNVQAVSALFATLANIQ